MSAAFVAYAATGWQATAAYTVVPNVPSWMALTAARLLGDDAPDPRPAAVRAFRELEAVPAERRGKAAVAKLATDQVVGAVALLGALAAGRLFRADGSLGRRAVAFLKLTVPAAVTLSLWGRLLAGGWPTGGDWLALPLATLAAGVWFAAAWGRAGWMSRAYLGAYWVALLAFGAALPAWGAVAVAGGLAGSPSASGSCPDPADRLRRIILPGVRATAPGTPAGRATETPRTRRSPLLAVGRWGRG